MRGWLGGALVAVSFTVAPIGADAATYGPDCCFGPAKAVSDPSPAGPAVFGVFDGQVPQALARDRGGRPLVAPYVDGRFAAYAARPGPAVGVDVQVGDVDGDNRDDLIVRAGRAVSVIRASPDADVGVVARKRPGRSRRLERP
ncbi:MAG TPA: hypothetical protein VK501_15375 [Baekduia sp.]|uniref:hypothetical protein n=1 Tax=Baekduia sp. TaxID=2600305 RepID=UPI002C58B5E1|nr:hypothetical protein [Baekduia sp.]HMJ35290.1 hypothetical protein [Baekduia sp.]